MEAAAWKVESLVSVTENDSLTIRRPETTQIGFGTNWWKMFGSMCADANLRRRNRFLQAQKHSEHLKSRHATHLAARPHQSQPQDDSNTTESELTSQLATTSQPVSQTQRLPSAKSPNAWENTVSGASASAPDSKMKLDFREAGQPSSGSEGSRTVITKITASTSYPCVRVPIGQQSFQCPCCCQTLIRDYAVDENLWR